MRAERLLRSATAVATAGLTAALAVAAGLLLWLEGRAIAFPYPLDYGEGPLLDQVVAFAGGENPYRADLTRPPYTVAVYPPLYAALQVPALWAFGPALWYGRLLSALGVALAAGACARIVWCTTGDRIGALAAGGLLLACPFVVQWAPLARVDGVALGLACAGLAVVVCGDARRRELVLAAGLLTAAVYTRQSAGLAAPFAAFVWLWQRHSARHAFALAGAVAALGLALLGALELATAGGFGVGVVTANRGEFGWRWVAGAARQTFAAMPGLVVVALGQAAIGARWRDPAWLAIAPFALGAALAALTVGKAGSNVNYLLEVAAALAMLAGAALAAARRRPWLHAALAFGLAVQTLGMVSWSWNVYAPRVFWKLERRAEFAALAELVAASPGPVLADESLALVPLAGRRVVLQPFEFSELARMGAWDETPLVEAIRRAEFPLVLLYDAPHWPSLRSRWTDAMRTALFARYDTTQRIAHHLVLEPRNAAGTRR